MTSFSDYTYIIPRYTLYGNELRARELFLLHFWDSFELEFLTSNQQTLEKAIGLFNKNRPMALIKEFIPVQVQIRTNV